MKRSRSCIACQTAHASCDGTHPCRRCTMRGIQCTFKVRVKGPNGKVMTVATLDGEESSSSGGRRMPGYAAAAAAAAAVVFATSSPTSSIPHEGSGSPLSQTGSSKGAESESSTEAGRGASEDIAAAEGERSLSVPGGATMDVALATLFNLSTRRDISDETMKAMIDLVRSLSNGIGNGGGNAKHPSEVLHQDMPEWISQEELPYLMDGSEIVVRYSTRSVDQIEVSYVHPELRAIGMQGSLNPIDPNWPTPFPFQRLFGGPHWEFIRERMLSVFSVRLLDGDFFFWINVFFHGARDPVPRRIFLHMAVLAGRPAYSVWYINRTYPSSSRSALPPPQSQPSASDDSSSTFPPQPSLQHSSSQWTADPLMDSLPFASPLNDFRFD